MAQRQPSESQCQAETKGLLLIYNVPNVDERSSQRLQAKKRTTWLVRQYEMSLRHVHKSLVFKLSRTHRVVDAMRVHITSNMRVVAILCQNLENKS